MESNISVKLSLFNFDEKYKSTLDKFLVTLGLITIEEIQQISDFLASKGIKISRPSQLKVFLSGYDYVVSTVNAYEQSGDLQALIEEPSRICCKGALERIQYLKQSGLPYLNDKGKYNKDAFSKTIFNQYYNVAPAVQPEPVVDSVPESNVSAFSEVTDDTIIITPVQPEPVAEPTEAVNVEAPIDNTVFEVSSSEEEPQDTYANTEMVSDPIAFILSKPQTIALNDETFDRYERLSDCVRQVLFKVYGVEEINDSITDNLIKLVTNEIPGDKDIAYRSITYGKEGLSEAEIQRLKNAISEELDYTDIMNLNLGR